MLCRLRRADILHFVRGWLGFRSIWPGCSGKLHLARMQPLTTPATPQASLICKSQWFLLKILKSGTERTQQSTPRSPCDACCGHNMHATAKAFGGHGNDGSPTTCHQAACGRGVSRVCLQEPGVIDIRGDLTPGLMPGPAVRSPAATYYQCHAYTSACKQSCFPRALTVPGGEVLLLALAGAEVTCFSHVPEAAALCIAATSGHLLMVDCETKEVEEVGIPSRFQFLFSNFIERLVDTNSRASTGSMASRRVFCPVKTAGIGTCMLRSGDEYAPCIDAVIDLHRLERQHCEKNAAGRVRSTRVHAVVALC